jgi:hypothetical protein
VFNPWVESLLGSAKCVYLGLSGVMKGTGEIAAYGVEDRMMHVWPWLLSFVYTIWMIF